MQNESQPALVRIAEAWSKPEQLFPLAGTEGYRLPDISNHTWQRIGEAERDNWFVAPPGVATNPFHCEFSGKHNAVVLGKGSIMHGRVGMLSDAATVIIGEESGHGSAANITVHGFGEGGVFFLGARSTSNQSVFFVQGDASRLIVGEDCMFAHGITCRTDDDHAIFSMADGAHLNPPADIHIAPHVWVCPEVSVLRGVNIGFGSIVAIKSLVNRSIPPFSLAGGAPAKLLREDVSWDRLSPPRGFMRQSLKDWYGKITSPRPEA